MNRCSLLISGSLCVLAAACTEDAIRPATTDNTTTAPTASTDTDTDTPDASTPVPTVSPWSSQSKHIVVRCGGFFSGGMEFRADRERLSATELALLGQLEVIAPAPGCAEDVTGCSLAITDADDSVTTYDAVSGNLACSDATPSVSYRSLAPFLDAIGCKFAKETLQVLEPDGGRCLHGMFAPYNGATTSLPVAISDPSATHRVTLMRCAWSEQQVANISMILVGSDGTVLAQGTPVADPGVDLKCLQMEFANVSSGEVVITTTGEYLPAGDFSLVFE